MPSTTAEEEATISIPSLAVVAVLGFFIYRYFFSSSASTSTFSGSSSSTSNRASHGMHFTPAQVDEVSAIFPQLNRRDIMWDLHRNRGSVAATTERILSGRGLDMAPPSFQPPPSYTAPTAPSHQPSSPAAQQKAAIDLITRYNLQDRISQNTKGKERAVDAETLVSGTTGPSSGGWSNNRDQRQATLKKRREEMILAARRKMMEKDEAAAAAGVAL